MTTAITITILLIAFSIIMLLAWLDHRRQVAERLKNERRRFTAADNPVSSALREIERPGRKLRAGSGAQVSGPIRRRTSGIYRESRPLREPVFPVHDPVHNYMMGMDSPSPEALAVPEQSEPTLSFGEALADMARNDFLPAPEPPSHSAPSEPSWGSFNDSSSSDSGSSDFGSSSD